MSVHLDFCTRQPRRRCTLHGAQGTLEWDAMAGLVSWSPGNSDAEHWHFDQDRDAPYRAQLQHFLDCIEQGAPPKVSLQDGIAALRLVDAARRANQESHPTAP